MMRDRRYGGDRFRSPTPPPRRLSPPRPPARLRDHRYSPPPPRRRHNMDVEDERRDGGGHSRRDYDRYYEKSFDRGGREYERNFSRGDRGNEREYDRNFSQGDRDKDRSFSCGGGDGDNGRRFSRGDGDGDNFRSYSRGGGGMRISDYSGGGGDRDRVRDYGDRERDRDDGRSRSMHRSSGSGEYTRRVYESNERTSSKFRWDSLFSETRKSDGFKSSLDNGVVGSGVRTDLEYDYKRHKYFDKGYDGLVLDSKPLLVEGERGRDYSSSTYPMNISFPTKSSGHVDTFGSGMSTSSHYSINCLHKGEDFHFHAKFDSEKLVKDGPVLRDPLARESYKDKPLTYSNMDTDYMVPSSRLKDFDPVRLGSFKEDIPPALRDELRHPSGGIRISTGVETNSIGYDGRRQKSRTRSPVDHEGRLREFKSYSRSYLGAAEESRMDNAYPLVGSSNGGGTLPRSIDSYGKSLGIGEDYRSQDSSRLGILEGDESSHQGYSRGSRMLDHHPASLGHPISDHYDAQQSFHARKKDVDDQGYGSAQPKYEREIYHGLQSSRVGEHDHDLEIARGPRSHHRRSDVLPSREYDPLLDDTDGGSQEKLVLGNMNLSKPSKNRLKRKHAEKQFIQHGSTSYDLVDAGEPWDDNVDSNIPSRSLKVGNSRYGKSRRTLNMTAHRQSPSGTNTFSSSVHTRKTQISGPRDIKKRLGPVAEKVHVSQRLAKKYKPSLRKRLGPGPQKNRVTLPWLKNLNAANLPRIQDGSVGSDHDQGEDPQAENVTPAKPEPPEMSEDFKQLVNIAFFKFVKQLNDTPAKRRKYKERAISGSLKCIVCRSQEEFVGTEGLATHVFTSQEIGLRSRHLGFHKALCALMGWKSAEKPNVTWSPEKLSDVENLTLKEDLILWPPVVIIHNSTIGNKSPDQQVIISIEEFETKLREMGFGDGTKVYRGKPANQSVLVVEFAGRLSGLQEAERLHEVYAGNDHGRAELLRINQNGETVSAPVNNMENILYGYLGIAEDLDKLDFDAKRRRVVKSRKAIKDIAEASIKTQ
ncbi:uncharacterized protein [Coffea arabica]|uniref:XS domain-containing protein n=1 Tax=Coffea arabica TaxID=13443 RepID=A0A6P6VV78_COFAR